MDFKYLSTVVFIVIFLNLRRASGELCGGLVEYDTSIEICLTNGFDGSNFVACKSGYCRRSDNTCHLTGDGSDCATNCKEINEREVNQCYCFGDRTGEKCDKAADQCADCTPEQVCVDWDTVCYSIVDSCLGVDCKNGGTCVVAEDNYECKCARNYMGKHCEFKKFGC